MKVTIQEVVNVLALASQRLGNAAQGKLSEETAMKDMMTINRLLWRMEDDGFDGTGKFEHKPEVAVPCKEILMDANRFDVTEVDLCNRRYWKIVWD
jgi:hypothetical protein